MRACDYSVWCIQYKDRKAHRTPAFGGMDSDFSHWEENVQMPPYLCVAPTEDLARAAFARYHHGEYIKDVTIEKIGQLDDLVYLQ
jgi:hypothetical protein